MPVGMTAGTCGPRAWGVDLPVGGRNPFPEADRPECYGPQAAEPVGGAGGDTFAVSIPRVTLFRGQGGHVAQVRQLQNRLNEAGFPVGRADGDFGPRTKQAVMRFQRANGLEPDGIVGAATWRALLGGRAAAPTPAPAPRAERARTARPTPVPQVTGETVATAAGPMVRRGSELISTKIAPMYDRMRAAAAKDGVSLRIRDGYRSHREQVVLWNRYGRDTSRVARPGHSNHQSGTAIDFQDTPGAWRWLKRHAHKFGLHNYAPEPWHYSLNGR